MDVQAVAAADRPTLVRYAAAIAENAASMLDDAEFLAAAGRLPRAYSLAALAIEEFGKASSVITLAVMPDELRARAPVRDLLKEHVVKQMGGLILGALEFGSGQVAQSLAATSASQLADGLSQLAGVARDTGRMRERGLYVDMNKGGEIQRPADISEPKPRRCSRGPEPSLAERGC